jgi:hypothetical protein
MHPGLAGGNMGGQLGFRADFSFPADREREKSSDFGQIRKSCQERVPPSALRLSDSVAISCEKDAIARRDVLEKLTQRNEEQRGSPFRIMTPACRLLNVGEHHHFFETQRCPGSTSRRRTAEREYGCAASLQSLLSRKGTQFTGPLQSPFLSCPKMAAGARRRLPRQSTARRGRSASSGNPRASGRASPRRYAGSRRRPQHRAFPA